MPFDRLYRKFRTKTIKTYWWRYEYPDKLNFGDEITPYIVKKLFGYECKWSPPDECELAGAGSIIEILQKKSNNNQVFVWGSGFIQEGAKNNNSNLIFTAVRGKKTLERVSDTDTATGDPGLLANIVFDSSKQKTQKVGILAHYADAELDIVKMLSNDSRFSIINPLDTPQKVALEITKCRLVLSSSLHGLVVSDSFSVPNAWLKLSDNLMGDSYKFYDYYSTWDKKPNPVDLNKIFDDNYLNDLQNSYSPIANLEHIQKELINRFPF